jgi:hypothetical protein
MGKELGYFNKEDIQINVKGMTMFPGFISHQRKQTKTTMKIIAQRSHG